jgi:nucleotide-binding universal stress UspA family protein
MMERILVVLNREDTAMSVLSTAHAVAGRLRSTKISVLCPRLPEDPVFMPTEEVMTDVHRRQFNRTSGSLAERLRAIFAEWRSSLPDRDDIRWLEVIGESSKSVGSEATQADLVVHSHLLGRVEADVQAAFHAALFDAAAPVLVAPAQPPRTVAARPLIAWEPTHAVSDAVTAALPLLVHADDVTILSVLESVDAPEPPPSGILALLDDANIPCRVERFRLRGQTIGNAILEEARKHRADLIVMGAYTHSAFVERFLGGATLELLAQAEVPLLLHH